MSCDEIWREIPNYIEGKHEAAMRTSIEEHLKNCKRCTAALGELAMSRGSRPMQGIVIA
jgi:hypothetical protein